MNQVMCKGGFPGVRIHINHGILMVKQKRKLIGSHQDFKDRLEERVFNPGFSCADKKEFIFFHTGMTGYRARVFRLHLPGTAGSDASV